MNKQPLISVIVPCYNQVEYLDECLQSVLNQTYTNWECIIVNDGSPDNTEEEAKKWLEKDSRFKYLKKENGGLSSARNAGIKISKGEWIQFLDNDDKISNEKFSDATPFFKDCDLVISDYQFFNEEGFMNDTLHFLNEKFSYESIIMKWDINYTIPIHCAIFKKLRINKLFNENLKAKEDWIFWIDYFESNPNYIFTGNNSAKYRFNQNGMTKNTGHMLANEEIAFLYIYDSLNQEMKRDFFKKRIETKNRLLFDLDEITKMNIIFQKKINSKRYRILDKILYLIGI